MAINNPVDSFMRGFAVVDQLETNRETRSFQRAQRSRMYEMWEREDEEYEKAKLRQYQQEKLVEFDYELKNVINSVAEEANQLEQAGKIKEAETLRNKWFTPNTFSDGEFRGVSLAVQEVVKKMQQRDPSFGEHVALAGGRDPGAGSLVDSKNPVANVFVVPPDASPNGQASIAFEVNRKDGKLGPMTANRTESGNDPIDFMPVDTQLMFKIFGPGFANNDLAAARLLRGMWEGADKGNPRATNKPDATASAEGSGKEQNRSMTITEDPEQTAGREEWEQQQRGGAPRADQDLMLPNILNYENPDEELPDAATDRFGRRVPTAQEIYGGVRLPTQEEQREAGRAVGEKMGFLQRGWKAAAAVLASRPAEMESRPRGDRGAFITGVVEGYTGEKAEEKAVSRPASNVREVREATDDSADKYNDGYVAEDPDGAIREAPIPDSEATAQAMAQDVQRTVRRPTIPQLMNAASLAKMGVIDAASLQRYARTGRWDEPSKAQFHSLGNSQFAIFTPDTKEVQFGGINANAGSGLAEIKTWQGYTNLMQDRTNGIFEENKAGQDAFLSSLDEVLRIFGNPMQTEEQLTAAANSGITRHIQQGAQFIQRYNPDTAQNLFEGTGDFWMFSDPELRFTPAAVAVGTQAAIHGIDNQYEANEYLTQYAWELNNAMQGISPAALIVNVKNLEQEVNNRLRTAAQNGKSLDRNAVRREVVEEFIESLGGG